MIDYINFGNVVNVSTSVPVAIDDSTYHIIIDFVPDDTMIFDNFHDDMAKILEHPDDYVLCNIEDIVKARDEIQELKDRIKELEGELAKAKKENQALKERNGKLEVENVTSRVQYSYWKNRFSSVVSDFSKTLAANGVEFSMIIQETSGDGKWDAVIDIPELTEAKNKIVELEQKLRLAESRETYWRDRKEEEEDYHHYWLHTYNLTVGLAATRGVHIFMNGEDKENNVGDIWVKNEKAEELEVKIGELEKDRDYWKDRFTKLKADIDTLKNKGRDLEKELKDLKSKTVAEVRYEWKSDGFTLIYTMCDGSKQTAGDDTDEKCTIGAFVCRSFNIPQCKNCMNHRYFTNGGHYCHLPDSKYTIPGMFHINSLTEEDAEGPACDKFEARKE